MLTTNKSKNLFDCTGRNTWLDICRSLAILLVLASHGRVLLPDFEYKILLSNGGFFGVELFFVLSGFLIGKILLQLVDENRTRRSDVLQFWKRRWHRTFPNYFLFLMLKAFVFSALFNAPPFNALYLVFLQNFAWPMPPLMGESWSLTVEEWFYVFVPLLLIAISRIKQSRIGPSDILIAITVLTVFRVLYVTENHHLLQFDADVRKIVVLRFDSLLFGVLAACVYNRHEARVRSNRHSILLLGCGITLSCIAIFSRSVMADNLDTLFNMTALLTLTSTGLALVVLSFYEMRFDSRPLASASAFVSKISYAAYLVHFSFVIPFMKTLSGQFGWLPTYTLYWILSVSLSALVYSCFEKPFMDLRDKKPERMHR